MFGTRNKKRLWADSRWNESCSHLQVYAEAKPAKKARRSRDGPSNPSCKPPLAIRPYPSQTLPTTAQR